MTIFGVANLKNSYNIPIATAREKYAAHGGYRAFVTRLCRERWQTQPNWVLNESDPLLASICRSAWVVHCDVCHEQLFIEPGEVYFCPNCLNAKHGNRARLVIFPNESDRAEIEKLLLKRVVPDTRNWNASETIGDLVKEQISHGEY